MKSLVFALLGALVLLPAAASADDAPATAQQERGCGMADSAFINQDSGTVTINCAGVSAQFGSQLAGVLTYVLQRRLDPETVIAKLEEMEGAPTDGKPRTLTADQGQALLQALVGSQPASIGITADPGEGDAANYALAIATRLGMAGWQIEGSQIRRTVPRGLEEIRGIALVVHDEKAPPRMAADLKKGLAAAKIFLPVIARPEIAANTALLWIGKRPVLDASQ